MKSSTDECHELSDDGKSLCRRRGRLFARLLAPRHQLLPPTSFFNDLCTSLRIKIRVLLRMRPVISYDDIADPLSKPTNDTPTTGGAEQFGGAQLGPQLPSHHQPPTKRRRPNQSRPQPNQQNHNGRQQSHQNQRSQPRQPVQHWDEPGTSNLSMNYGGDEEEAGVDFNGEALDEEQGEEEEEEESRELTHEEIWDDSALIDAWNSASAEYEVSIANPSRQTEAHL